MKTVTLFTPSYNRAYTLPKLYASLCRQTSDDFIWSIVDDGSTDNTEEIVKLWQQEGKVEIIYEKQPNGGKMRAHNRGVQKCQTELFCCIDSDDFITDTAVEVIIRTWQSRSEDGFVGGIAAYRAIREDKNDGKYDILCRFPITGYSGLKQLYLSGFKGDTTLVFRIEVIRQYLFPEIEGEKFITEAYAYEQMDVKYKYLLLDEALTLCEYMEDGYTRNASTLNLKNPKGAALYYNQTLKLFPKKGLGKLRDIMYYIIYSRIGGNKQIYANSTVKSLLYFVAWCLSFYYQYKLSKLMV
jgi:glycosyltransferase involved in cell wall biosynthesis